MATPVFTEKDTIGDILLQLPAASEILMSYGLGCVGCHVSAYESLGGGIRSHGMDESDLEVILKDLNEAANDPTGTAQSKAGFANIIITNRAKDMLDQFAHEQNSVGYGLRVDISFDIESGPEYFLDFEKDAEPGDRILVDNGIKIYANEVAATWLKTRTLDYVSGTEKPGFTFLSQH